LIPYLLPKLQTTTFSQKIDFQELNEDDLDILIERIMNE